MLSLILSLLGNPIARLLLYIGLGLVAFKGYTSYERHVGKEQLIQQSETEGKKLDVEAQKARKSADVPDALVRLRRQFCSDCKG